MKKLLITGFEPFGGELLNPSREAVFRLPDTVGDYSLTKMCLPVCFGSAAEMLINEADRLCPDAVICGHLHQYIRQDANAKKFDEKSNASWLKAKKPLTVIPYHMIVNSTNAVLEGTVSPEKLEIRIWEPVNGGKDQKLFDTISIKAKK